MKAHRSWLSMLLVVVMMSTFLCSCDTAKPSSSSPSAPSSSLSFTPVTYDKMPVVGYYCYPDGVNTTLESEIAFAKASGFNMLEILDISWFFKPGAGRDGYLEGLKNNIQKVQEAGLKAYIILMTNLEQWTGDAPTGNGQGKMFDPADEAKMAERLEYIQETIDYCKAADGFSLFAGDPGGVTGTDAEGDIQYYVDMAKKVQDMVKQTAPDAAFNMNLWAVSQYVAAQSNPMEVDFWLAEDENARKIIAMENVLGPEIGLEVAGHDYYRTTALKLYSLTGKSPDVFPNAVDVKNSIDKGASTWAFSHSLLPDGSDVTGIPFFNTVRVYEYVSQMREIGMQGLVCGSVVVQNYADLYAYGRFANDPSATPETVLREYAGYVASADTAEALTEIFKFLNNYDRTTWEQELAETYRTPLMDTSLKSGREALALFDTVQANADPAFSLPESAQKYLSRIEKKLEKIAGGEPPADWDGTKMSKWLYTFDEDVVGINTTSTHALNGRAGKLMVSAGGKDGKFNLIGTKIDPVDLSDMRYGYLHLDVYVTKDTLVPLWFVCLGSAEVPVYQGPHTEMFRQEFTLFKAGWNHITIPLSSGSGNAQPIDWTAVQNWYITFGNYEDDFTMFYFDNFYVANTADGALPG